MKVTVVIMMTFLLLSSCSVEKKIPGNYSTKLASQGFFGTSLSLSKDSTFVYRFAGDLIDRRGIGRYSVHNRRISLTYLPSQYDTILLGARVDTLWTEDRKILRIDVTGIPVLDSAVVENRPRLYYYKNNRLLYVGRDGRPHRGKGFVYSPRRKYFLFGTHYFYRYNPLHRTR